MKVRCPNCGYDQDAAEFCAMCNAPLSSKKEQRRSRGKTFFAVLAIVMFLAVFAYDYFDIPQIYQAHATCQKIIRNNQGIKATVGRVKYSIPIFLRKRTAQGVMRVEFQFWVKGSIGSTRVRLALYDTMTSDGEWSNEWEVEGTSSYTDRGGRRKSLLKETKPPDSRPSGESGKLEKEPSGFPNRSLGTRIIRGERIY
jgi:hypothetical protein